MLVIATPKAKRLHKLFINAHTSISPGAINSERTIHCQFGVKLIDTYPRNASFRKLKLFNKQLTLFENVHFCCFHFHRVYLYTYSLTKICWKYTFIILSITLPSSSKWILYVYIILYIFLFHVESITSRKIQPMLLFPWKWVLLSLFLYLQ